MLIFDFRTLLELPLPQTGDICTHIAVRKHCQSASCAMVLLFNDLNNTHELFDSSRFSRRRFSVRRATFGLTKPLKMNMVKRIMGRPRQEECSPQDNALGLMHLRRLFSELCHPPRHMTQKEQEEKLYMMLPVFNRVSHSRGDGLMRELIFTAVCETAHSNQELVLPPSWTLYEFIIHKCCSTEVVCD